MGSQGDVLRILFTGLGGIGQRHVRNLRALLGDQVEISAHRVRGFKHVITEKLTVVPSSDVECTYQISTYPSLEAALAQRPDAVFVTNPTSLHISTALAAGEARCNLFIEKPLAHSEDGVDKLVELVEKHNLVALVGYQLRFHPCLQLVKRLLDEKAIGTLLDARFEVGEYLPSWHPYEDYRQMYASRRNLGGGVILSQIHELDLVYWLFGMPSRVFALGGHWSSLDIDVEGTSSMLLECSCDGRPLPVHVHQDYIQRAPTRTLEIIGEHGKILADIDSNQVRVLDERTLQTSVHRFDDFERNHMFIAELRHFLSCLRREEKPIVSVRDGANSLRIALAAKESIAKRSLVDIPSN